MWATEEAKGALSAAIEAAKKVAENADALIEEIAKAKDDVTGAKEAYEGSQKPGTPDKTKLEDMIEAAGETGVTVSADGLDKDPTELWVTEERMNAFRSALADAEALMADDKATIKQIKAQTEALDEAIKSLKADAKAGTPDKSALEALLKDAKDAANNIMISENGGTDVEASDIWVTREVMETFDAAVKKADEVIGNADATMDEIDAAAENLAESIELLNRSKAKGAPDKTALITAIANAQAARDAVVVSEAGDGSDIDPDENWIDVSSAEKMDEAIKGAIAVLEDDGAKISEIASQVKKLTAIVSKITGKPGTPDKGGLTSAESEAKLIEGNINVTSED
ncbi:MAG: FIVAR domain-containing protein, partial [Firmicutes bacterium]|nr:FIVAR domain-containing protein [Bacillota bacterium]